MALATTLHAQTWYIIQCSCAAVPEFWAADAHYWVLANHAGAFHLREQQQSGHRDSGVVCESHVCTHSLCVSALFNHPFPGLQLRARQRRRVLHPHADFV